MKKKTNEELTKKKFEHSPPTTIGGIGGGCIAPTLGIAGDEAEFCREVESRVLFVGPQNCGLESLDETGRLSEFGKDEDVTTFGAVVEEVEVGRDSGAGTLFEGCINV